MNQTTEDRFQRLLHLAGDLYAETSVLSETESELQLWYNRGYADGMASRMRLLGYQHEVNEALGCGGETISDEQRFLPWGKAYRHGFEMGEKETLEVLGEKNL
ncbi:MAG: hypothetical protein ABW104_16785 [Candidatus Thiodiazotropha sp. 6PLUC2]